MKLNDILSLASLIVGLLSLFVTVFFGFVALIVALFQLLKEKK